MVDATDPYYGFQWGLKDNATNADINAPQAWDVTQGVTNVIIAVLDTGIDIDHQDLDGKIVDPFNAITNATTLASVNDTDPACHGTVVAGNIAAETNNNYGIAGVARNCKIMPIKVDDDMTAPSIATIVNGINKVRDKAIAGKTSTPRKRYVMNLSWKVADSASLHSAIIDAYNNDVVIVAAAGDSSTDIVANPVYPASYAEVIPVGAHIRNAACAKQANSNFGSNVVMAPGENCRTTIINTYGDRTGTSVAASFVSGTAALCWSKDYQIGSAFNCTGVQIRNAILNHLTPVAGYANKGRVDARKAVDAVTT